MSGWDLPRSVDVNGRSYEIRSDYRVALDLMAILGDPDIEDGERGDLAFSVFYPGYADMPASDYDAAREALVAFLSGGQERPARGRPRLVDWEQDFPLIVGPVNRVLGYEVRDVPYDFAANEGGLHWWTFLSAYIEVGDCTFAQVVSIRKKKSQGKKLDARDKEFYAENRDIIDMRKRPSAAVEEELGPWIKG